MQFTGLHLFTVGALISRVADGTPAVVAQAGPLSFIAVTQGTFPECFEVPQGDPGWMLEAMDSPEILDIEALEEEIDQLRGDLYSCECEEGECPACAATEGELEEAEADLANARRRREEWEDKYAAIAAGVMH